MNYVFLTFTESAETLKNSVDHFHSFIFMYKTDTTPVAGGSCDYQNFCNKIVIPTPFYLQLCLAYYDTPLHCWRRRPAIAHQEPIAMKQSTL